MKEAHAENSRLSRLLVVAGGVCLLAAAGAPTAAAGLGLSDATESGLPATAAIQGAAETLLGAAELDVAAQVRDQPLPEAPAGTIAQATNVLAQTAAPTLAQTSETLAQVTTPVLEPVQQTPLLPATLDTLSAVTESVVSPVAETLAVVESGRPPQLQQAGDELGPALETRAPVLGALGEADTTAPRAEGAPGVSEEKPVLAAPTPELPAALPGATSPDRARPTPPARKALGMSLNDPAVALLTLPSVPGGHEGSTGDLRGAKASAPLPSAPAPFSPGGPLSGLAPASASAGAGVLLLAALAATLFLAAPGLGRRLRPRLAPWPQPIPQFSLERPG